MQKRESVLFVILQNLVEHYASWHEQYVELWTGIEVGIGHDSHLFKRDHGFTLAFPDQNRFQLVTLHPESLVRTGYVERIVIGIKRNADDRFCHVVTSLAG